MDREELYTKLTLARGQADAWMVNAEAWQSRAERAEAAEADLLGALREAGWASIADLHAAYVDAMERWQRSEPVVEAARADVAEARLGRLLVTHALAAAVDVSEPDRAADDRGANRCRDLAQQWLCLFAACLYPIRRATWCRWRHNWHGIERWVCDACSENWPAPRVAAHQHTEEGT